MSFLHEIAVQHGFDPRIASPLPLDDQVPRQRRWRRRRAARLSARKAAAVQPRPVDVPGAAAVVLAAEEIGAVIEAHIRVPEQRLPEPLPQTPMAHPGQ
jgi:hypothetical protein